GPLRARPASAGARGAAVPPLPDLDVAQHRCRGVRRMAARMESRAAGRAAHRLLRPGPLQSLGVAARRARLPRRCRSAGRNDGAAESWNLRDTHMLETLEALLQSRGPDAKAVVWAHNSHIGDASKTEMGAVREELNIGQLCRERFGKAAALIGFGTHTGTVAC